MQMGTGCPVNTRAWRSSFPLPAALPRGLEAGIAAKGCPSVARPASHAPNLDSRRSRGEVPGPGLEVLKSSIFDMRDGVTGE